MIIIIVINIISINTLGKQQQHLWHQGRLVYMIIFISTLSFDSVT